MRARLEALPEPVCLLLLALAWLACTGLSLALCGDGFLHPESESFLPHFLSDRTLLTLLYDNRVTDWGNYQARELGFLFDWLDAQFIAVCAARGVPHFFSACHYLLHGVAGLALWQIATRHLGLSRVLTFGLVLLLWTGPSALLYTSFYRSAKAGLLCATLLAAWAWCTARARGGWRTALFGLLAAALPMWDKQGLLFLGALVLWLVRDAWLDRTPRTRALLAAGLGALVFAWCYQRFLGPALTRHLLGYEVNRGYVSIPWGALATQPRYAATVLLGALLLAFDSFRFPLGSLPAGLALLALWWLWRQCPADARPAPLRPGTAFLALGVFIAAVFAAMLLLFPLLFSSEHRRFFYGLPVTALWLLAVAAVLAAALRRAPERARWIELAVAALVVSNFFSAQEHRFVLRHGKYAPFVENATRVRAALRPAALAAAGLTRAAAASRLDLAPYVRDAVAPELMDDRIYLTLAARAADH